MGRYDSDGEKEGGGRIFVIYVGLVLLEYVGRGWDESKCLCYGTG